MAFSFGESRFGWSQGIGLRFWFFEIFVAKCNLFLKALSRKFFSFFGLGLENLRVISSFVASFRIFTPRTGPLGSQLIAKIPFPF